jgi:uncharacterized membrane protein (DUF106 family)
MDAFLQFLIVPTLIILGVICGIFIKIRLDMYIHRYRSENDYKTAERPYTENQKKAGLEEIRRDLQKMNEKLDNTVSYRKRSN